MSSQHRECYGRLLPDLEAADKEPKGRVFSLSIPPVMGMVRPRAEARVKIEEWDQCRKCEEFSYCLDLSTAKLCSSQRLGKCSTEVEDEG